MQENSWLSTWTDSSVSTPPPDLQRCSEESNCGSGTGELVGGAAVMLGGGVSVGDAEYVGEVVTPGIEADGDSLCGVGVRYVLAGAGELGPDDTGATVTHWPLLQAFTPVAPGNAAQALSDIPSTRPAATTA